MVIVLLNQYVVLLMGTPRRHHHVSLKPGLAMGLGTRWRDEGELTVRFLERLR